MREAIKQQRPQLYLFIDDVRYSNFIARRAPPNLTHEISIAQVTKHSANK
jgi:hypothetical protein